MPSYIFAQRRERSEANNRVLFEIPRYLYIYIYIIIIIIITSRDSPPSASFHCYGAPLTTFPQRYFSDDATTITILVYLTMLGQCMLPATIAYDNGECKDYTQSDGVYSF